MKLTLPSEVVFDNSAEDLECYVLAMMQQRMIPSNIMVLILYKVLSKIQAKQINDYSARCIREVQTKEEEKAKANNVEMEEENKDE